jgi:hypothetical protein
MSWQERVSKIEERQRSRETKVNLITMQSKTLFSTSSKRATIKASIPL